MMASCRISSWGAAGGAAEHIFGIIRVRADIAGARAADADTLLDDAEGRGTRLEDRRKAAV